MYFKNGRKNYEGSFEQDKPHGVGKRYYETGDGEEKILYSGEFFDGHCSGHGTLYHENGNIRYVGQWDLGDPKGLGKMYDVNGVLEFDGNF